MNTSYKETVTEKHKTSDGETPFSPPLPNVKEDFQHAMTRTDRPGIGFEPKVFLLCFLQASTDLLWTNRTFCPLLKDGLKEAIIHPHPGYQSGILQTPVNRPLWSILCFNVCDENLISFAIA